MLLVAIDNGEEITELVKLVQHEYPKVKIVDRARNRMHAIELSKLGVSYFVREIFESYSSCLKRINRTSCNCYVKAEYLTEVVIVIHCLKCIDEY